jgi:hypothetical protein
MNEHHQVLLVIILLLFGIRALTEIYLLKKNRLVFETWEEVQVIHVQLT